MISLYDLFEYGQRVYVGITSLPKERLWQHKARGTVNHTAKMVIVRVFETWEAARKAERERIKEFAPPGNRMKPSERPSPKEVAAANEKVRLEAYADAWAKLREECDAAFVAICKAWKKEGRTVREIVGMVKAEYNIKLSNQTVWKYTRDKS
jgi:hypothetical protein